VCPIRIQATLFAACRNHLGSRSRPLPHRSPLVRQCSSKALRRNTHVSARRAPSGRTSTRVRTRENAGGCGEKTSEKEKSREVGGIALREPLYLVGLTGVKEVSAGLLLFCHTGEERFRLGTHMPSAAQADVGRCCGTSHVRRGTVLLAWLLF